MSKPKNLFKIPPKEYEKYVVDFKTWHHKVNFLKEEINKLGKLDKFPIFCISAFLLKVQVIEFELKQLFTSLDLEIAVSLRITESSVKRIIRHPDDFKDKTLGQTIGLFCEYNGIVKDELKSKLITLNTLRNKFIHHMFDSDTTDKQLISEAIDGIKLEDKILALLPELNKRLDDPWKKGEK